MADVKEKESKANKETKEEKKNTKKESVKDPIFKQLYDVWGLIGQIEAQAQIIRSQSKNRMVKDQALIMLTRIEMLKQIYLSDAEGVPDERSN
jgi:hypothetical protein